MWFGDYAVTVIDKNPDVLQKLALQMDVMTVTANAKQVSNLEEIGIEDYDVLLASTDDDEKNIFIAAAAKNGLHQDYSQGQRPGTSRPNGFY